MEILKPTLLERLLASLWRLFFHEEKAHPLATQEQVQLYASSMFESGNSFHRTILRQWSPHIRIDEANLEGIQLKASQGIVVYVAYNLGQLEYHVFNEIFLQNSLPLAFFNNAVRTRRWLSFSHFWKSYWERIRFLARHAFLPDPIESGFIKNLITENKSLLFSLNEWNPDYLASNTQHFFDHLFQIQKEMERPIFIVPIQLIWDKRPKKEKASIYEALFGENERPGRWRKMVLFFRHYKNRAVVKCGAPIELKTIPTALALYQKLIQVWQIERRTLTGPILHPKQWFLEKILEDEGLSRTIYEVSKEKNKPLESVKQLSRKYAREIIGDLRYNYIEFTAAILNWIFKNLFEGIWVDTEGLHTLKKTLSRGPLILVSNHRSHLDYLLLGYLSYHHDIVSPYVAAGINLAFFPLGGFFRRCGAFFLRRSFEGNRLYKKVFQTYLKVLIEEGYLQEFFIEGGRSRTGKLRRPRLGMLSMYSEVMAEGAAKDIYFMPVSITYDRVLEEKSYVEEMQGKTKSKEKIWDLLKLGKFLKGRYGKIYVNFDEAISWQEVASRTSEVDIPGLTQRVLRGDLPRPQSGREGEAPTTRSGVEGATRAPITEWEKKKSKVVLNLADRIMHAINKQVVVTPKSLVASAILLKPLQGVAQQEIEKTFQELLRYFQWKQVKLSDTLLKNPDHSLKEALNQFESAGLIKRHHGFEQTFFEILKEKRFDLDLFKNVSIHYLVSISLFSTLLLARGEEKQELDHLIKEYAGLQELFQYEFRFSTRRPLAEHLDKLCCYLQEQKAINYSQGRIEIPKEGLATLKNFSLLIQNYLEAYWAAWDTFLLRPTKPLQEKEMVKATLQHAKDQFLLGKLKYPEAISQSIFENAMQSFKTLGFFSLDSLGAKKLRGLLSSLLIS